MTDICVIGTRGVPNFVGGIETICRELYPNLKLLSPDLEIVILARLSANTESHYNYRGVEVRVISGVSWSGFETFFHTFLALIYARLFVHPKIIHLHGIGPGLFSALARVFLFKTVVTHHSQDFLRPKWNFLGRAVLKLGELVSCLFAHRIICVSEAIKKDLDERFPILLGKRMVIRNAGSLIFDNDSKNSRTILEMGLEPQKYILAVGRLEETKAFHELIGAFKLCGFSDLKLVIVGSDYTNSLYIKELFSNASDNILFVGKRFESELASLYLNAKFLVNPSHMEGFCLVVAEALSANLPVILSDIPPHREFCLPDACYFQVGDVNTLTQKLKNHDDLNHLYDGAFTFQQKNTWLINTEKHLQLFTELL